MKISRRTFLKYSLAYSVAGSSLLLAEQEACAYNPSKIEVIKKNVFINNLPEDFEDFKIVQLSDLHRGDVVKAWLIKKVVSIANNLKPDCIVITGDLANNAEYLEDSISYLNTLSAPKGVFVISGNWERVYCYSSLNNLYKKSNLTFIDNTFDTINIDKSKIYIAGVKDDGGYGRTLKSTFDPINDKFVKLLLVHNPYTSVHLFKAKKNIDFVLSGHTHGGQVVYPIIGPVKLPTAFGKKFRAGLYKLDHSKMYVNKGIGVVHFPYRINCPPEITVHTLKNANNNT